MWSFQIKEPISDRNGDAVEGRHLEKLHNRLRILKTSKLNFSSRFFKSVSIFSILDLSCSFMDYYKRPCSLDY